MQLGAGVGLSESSEEKVAVAVAVAAKHMSLELWAAPGVWAQGPGQSPAGLRGSTVAARFTVDDSGASCPGACLSESSPLPSLCP